MRALRSLFFNVSYVCCVFVVLLAVLFWCVVGVMLLCCGLCCAFCFFILLSIGFLCVFLCACF